MKGKSRPVKAEFIDVGAEISEIRVILTTCDSRMKVFMPSMDPDYFRTCPKEGFVMFQ